MAFAVSFSFGAHAACSPGIPCTDYDIYNDTTSGTDAGLNGPKTGTPAPHTNTTGSTTSACDGNFMNQIYSQAYMGASREVIMSEQIIHKPDSVLEYTCFDQWAAVTAEHAPTFSESTFWENHEICTSTGDSTATAGRPPTCASSGDNTVSPYEIEINVVYPDTTLDDTIRLLVYDSLQTYIDNNFSHTFLGEATTIDNDIDTTGSSGSQLGSGSYNCSHMATVWNIAKCIDFMEDDRFRTFEDLVNADPRSIPAECSPSNSSVDTIEAGNNSTKLDSTSPGSSASATSVMDPCPAAGTPVSGVNTDFSNDLIRVANNCDDSSNINAYSSFDVMELIDEMILGVQLGSVGTYIPGTGGSTSGVVTCSDPLPTGVPIITYQYDRDIGGGPGLVTTIDRTARVHYEHICPNPGCYYVPVKQPYIVNGPMPSSTPTGTCVPY
ncbi:MAG: hypothetical protein ACTHOO_10765 [Alcanivorax sp.]